MVRFQTSDDILQQAYAAYSRKDYATSAKFFERAVGAGITRASVLYDAACTWALAGEKEKAFGYLEKAIRFGFHNVEHLKADTDLSSLQSDVRFARAVTACAAVHDKYRREHSDPRRVKFVTDDIARFQKAYESAMETPPGDWAPLFQRLYIDPGTVGLNDFAASGRLNPDRLARAVKQCPRFYAQLQGLAKRVAGQERETRSAFQRLRQLLPDAQFPDVYFVIGQMGSGGTSSENGLLMGAEMFTRSPGLPVEELTSWQRNAMMPLSDIPPLVTHEAIHFQQQFGGGETTLLRAVITEGSADFLGEMASGRLIKRMQETHLWANAREQALWQEFEKEMGGSDFSRWLYKEQPDRPVDLGYWIGYKICEAYVKNAPDKTRALKEIVTIKDFSEFLARSGYVRKFASGGNERKQVN